MTPNCFSVHISIDRFSARRKDRTLTDASGFWQNLRNAFEVARMLDVNTIFRPDFCPNGLNLHTETYIRTIGRIIQHTIRMVYFCLIGHISTILAGYFDRTTSEWYNSTNRDMYTTYNRKVVALYPGGIKVFSRTYVYSFHWISRSYDIRMLNITRHPDTINLWTGTCIPTI